jgi:hypothetical protein
LRPAVETDIDCSTLLRFLIATSVEQSSTPSCETQTVSIFPTVKQDAWVRRLSRGDFLV